MHLNAKSALRRMKRTYRFNNRLLPAPLAFNRRAMIEAVERAKDLLRAVPQLTEVVVHVPQLHTTNGWAGSKRRQGERIVVTHATKVPSYA